MTMMLTKTEANALKDPIRTVTCAYVRQQITPYVGEDEADRIASAVALDCPLDIQTEAFSRLYAFSPNADPYESERRAQALKAMGETVDTDLSYMPTALDTLENALLRVGVARDAGVISASTARSITCGVRRRLRQLKRVGRRKATTAR